MVKINEILRISRLGAEERIKVLVGSVPRLEIAMEFGMGFVGGLAIDHALPEAPVLSSMAQSARTSAVMFERLALQFEGVEGSDEHGHDQQKQNQTAGLFHHSEWTEGGRNDDLCCLELLLDVLVDRGVKKAPSLKDLRVLSRLNESAVTE